MVAPQAAPVSPRAFGPESGDSLPLEDLIDPDASGVVAVIGGRGCGKSTALAHIAARFSGLTVLDEPSQQDVGTAEGPIVYAAREPLRIDHAVVLRLAPWGQDELLEYLEARWPDRLRSVMGRILQAHDRDLPAGVPELWCAVLDAMAKDGDVSSVREAWRRGVPDDAQPATRGLAFRLLRGHQDGWNTSAGPPRGLLRHEPYCAVLAAEHLAETLRDGHHTLPPGFITPQLLSETALLADAGLLARLEEVLASDRDHALHPLAASVVFGVNSEWRPRRGCRLRGGHFPRARWSGIELSGADLREIILTGADLGRARLRRTTLARAQLAGATLVDAGLTEAQLVDASLARADLTRVRAAKAKFDGADLSGATLGGGYFGRALFGEAKLRGAQCVAADFTDAHLTGADLEDADFTDACFDRATLVDADLRLAEWAGASFAQARLTRARLEGLSLQGANLTQARLVEAHLTDTDLETADLRGASLRNARAAGVVLMQANLVGADLRGMDFHLGSSRSGLVGSPTAREGSMTGYYDDEDDVTFRAPEEIRTANMCGADLRGALLEGTDFWRVDLRGAQLDPGQRLHVQRCGAIL